jgi:hypothetical protein
VREYTAALGSEEGFTLCQFAEPINVASKFIRNHESSIGDFLSDIARIQTKSEVALIHSGTIRYEGTISSKNFDMNDLE